MFLSVIINHFVNIDEEIAVPLRDEVQFTIDDQPVSEGDIVTIYSGKTYGYRQGRIDAICDNPYYGRTGLCVYVVSLEGEPFWTEYVVVEVTVS